MAGIRNKVLALLFGTGHPPDQEPRIPAFSAPGNRAAPVQKLEATDTETQKHTSPRVADYDNFEKKLLSVLSDQPECMVGRLNLVGLDAVKAALGPKWEAAQARVHEKVSQIIARHLGPQDVFLRHSDVEYLICHAALTDQQARLKSFQIAREIHSYFIGNVELSALTIRTAVAKVGRGVAFETVKFDDVSII